MAKLIAVQTSIDTGIVHEPDPLVQAQYYRTTQRTYYASPELRLMAAVLEDAVATLTADQRRCNRHQQREFADALAWMNNKDGTDWVLSFETVCQALVVDASYLRQGLLRKIDQLRKGEIARVERHEGYLSPRRNRVRLRAG